MRNVEQVLNNASINQESYYYCHIIILHIFHIFVVTQISIFVLTLIINSSSMIAVVAACPAPLRWQSWRHCWENPAWNWQSWGPGGGQDAVDWSQSWSQYWSQSNRHWRPKNNMESRKRNFKFLSQISRAEREIWNSYKNLEFENRKWNLEFLSRIWE